MILNTCYNLRNLSFTFSQLFIYCPLCGLPACSYRSRREDVRFCVKIRPPNMFPVNFSPHSFIFICQSPSPASFETPSLLSVSLLLIFSLFSSPPVTSLKPFHLSTPTAHPHSNSSPAPGNLDPAFCFTTAFCP